MGDALKRLCTICARGGSKGVVNKNVRPILGKPLFAYSIDQARASGLFDWIAVSSDSPEILGIARSCGVEVLVDRPAALATDDAGKLPAIRHCVEAAERSGIARCDVVVDLDVTSPLRSIADIHGAVALLESPGASSVITAATARRSPYFNLVEVAEDGAVRLSKPPAQQITRRQDAPRCFDMNASIYVWRRDALFAFDSIFTPGTRLFVMPEERSIDIDSELDFRIVEMLLTEGKGHE